MIDRLVNIFGSFAKALEIVCLLEDTKPVVRQGFYENELPRIKRFCGANNLSIQTSPYKVVIVDAKEGEYSNKGVKAKLNDERKGMIFAYISKDEENAVLANYHELKNNHAQLGNILGYPKCCVEFFAKNQPERSAADNDYIVPMLTNTDGNSFPFYNNILLRNQDISLLSHFPCSLNCSASAELGKKYLSAVRKHDSALAEQIASKLKGHHRIFRRILKFV